MTRFFQKTSGFTMAEMLIVIAIIGFLSLGAVNMYFDSQRRALFNNDFQQIVVALREARNLAISSKSITVAGEDIVPAGGYGVLIDNSGDQTVLEKFIDTYNDAQTAAVDIINQPIVVPDHLYTSGQDQKMTDVELSRDLIISIEQGGTPINNPVAITFLPPSGETFITNNDSGVVFNEIVIRVEHATTSLERSIRFNRISRFPVIE